VTFVPSSDARFDARANTYGTSEREERVMGVVDFELQRERRMEMLRKAPRLLPRLAGVLALIR
jgi:hypothetical protein